MRNKLVPAAVLVSLWAPLEGQTSPHLAGTVEVDLPRGVITGDLCLSNLPTRADTVRFVLHRGLNVKRIRDGTGSARPYVTEPEPQGVGLRYAIGSAASDTLPPSAVVVHETCVEYTGAFPVYDVEAGDYAMWDGSGVVAFNGRTLRARGQTRWYPVPYDTQTDQAQESLTFQLRVRCPSCKQVYLNGTSPQPGPDAMFVSDTPREVVILGGDLPVQHVSGMLLLGEEAEPDTARLFVQQLAEIQRFYEEFLEVPYGRSIDFARIIPVRFDRPFQMWGFFSDPIMGVTGVTLADFVQVLSDPDHQARPHLFGFLGHELAHRYFSGPLGGPYNQLFSEPFANYLGLKATRHFSGEAPYRDGLQALHQQVMESPDLPRLDQADPRTLGSDPYRYRYVPLLLFALEREIGEERMRRVLHALLTAPEAEQSQADYEFFRRTALRAGVPQAAWQRWENDCMRPSISRNRCLQALLQSQ